MTIACSKFKLHHFYCAQPKWSVLLVRTILAPQDPTDDFKVGDSTNGICSGREMAEKHFFELLYISDFLFLFHSLLRLTSLSTFGGVLAVEN